MRRETILKRKKLGEKGFTLIELVFVIAIILILTALFLPPLFSQLDASRTNKADADIQEIAAGIMAFFNDLDEMPTCSAACSTTFTEGIVFLAFGEGFGSLSADYPAETAWNLDTSDETTEAQNNGANHLLINSPDGDTNEDEVPADYKVTGVGKAKRWQGPYLSRVGKDPYGKTYIAYVGAMSGGGQKLSGSTGIQRGWIISAGGDSFLDTAPDDRALTGDDRGFILTTK